MKKSIGIMISICLLCIYTFSQVRIQNPLCENLPNPIGVGSLHPRFTWQLVSDKRNIQQVGYEIRVGTDPVAILKQKNIIWNSGRTTSSQSVLVAYNGKELSSNAKYFWQVRVWDNVGKVSEWSPIAYWQMGLLKSSDWKGSWIRAGFTEDSIMRQSPLFRKGFASAKKIQNATAYITSLGMYEARINGNRVGKYYLTPGWTSYNERLQYQSYDVTSLLRAGDNAIGITLGSGWYRTKLGWETNKDIYGKEIALLFQLHINYSDGSNEIVVSDNSWKSSEGAIRSSEIYNGEIYDANREIPAWTTAGYDDKNWNGVKILEHKKDHLIATYNEPIQKQEEFKSIRSFITPAGEQVIDFGQNLVGWVQMKVKGSKGDSVRIYHAEVLDKAGNFYTKNLRAAKQENIYILKGGIEETFEPHFTFQGFRYIMIKGYPGQLIPENFTAVALYSAMKPTGTFTTSNPLLNQLQHNIQWGQKGNFLDVPTDCPQRDERLGWTGDAQAFCRTATFNMQVHNFFAKWLKDLEADQSPDGRVPFVIPTVLGEGAGGSAGWADAATIIPWNLYLAYGDTQILKQQYSSMKAWVGFMEKNSTAFLWNKGFHFGDWLFYRPDDDNDGRGAITDKYLIAQCFFAHSTQLLLNAAKILGRNDDVTTYSSLLKNVKEAFLKEYVTANGRLVSGTQTAYVLALNFDMLPESLRQPSAERLVENIKNYNHHLTTGFLGTPYICHVLTRFGYTDIAYKLLLQETYPSWLYPVKMGATTIWERWDGQKPDSSFQTPGMNSFNHYAYGAIGDWMYRVIAGIDTDESGVGYKKIRIKPHVGGGLTNVSAELETYYGAVKSHWIMDNGRMQLNVRIPANTTAVIYIPATNIESIMENKKLLSANTGMKALGKEGNYFMVEVGSGDYTFSITN